MCYAKSLTASEEDIEEYFQREFEVPLLYEPYYWITGFHHPNVFIIPQDDPERIWPATWGLIPEYAMDYPVEFRKKVNTLNARSEQVFVTRSYKNSIVDERCLIIANGFFEPHHHNGTSYPHYCRLKSQSLFVFAGIYTKLDDELYTCSIITVPANEFFAEVHNNRKRMPLVLDTQFEEEWIRTDLDKTHIKELMKAGFTKEEFEAYPVTRKLNVPKFTQRNSTIAITKVDYPELNEQGRLF